MTERIFGASTPITPPSFPAQDLTRRRIARIAWLVTRFVRKEPVRYEQYKERFGAPSRPFCCEVAALREAGIIRGSELLARQGQKDVR